MKNLLFLVLCYFFWVTKSLALQVDESRLASAFIYNFIKQVTWQGEEKKRQFVVAVYKDQTMYAALQNTISQKFAKNKPISVNLVNDVLALSSADIAVLPESINQNLAAIATSLRKTNTLLITSNSIDKRDIMINLVFDQALNKMLFEVNKSNILFEGLTLSNTLLLLGGTEVDVAVLYRETEKAMAETKEREQALTLLLGEKKETLAATSLELRSMQGQIKNYQKSIKANQQALDSINIKALAQQKAIKVKEALLIESSLKVKQSDASLLQVQNELAKALQNVQRQQNVLKNSFIQQNDMKAQIERNLKTLEQQKGLIQSNNNLLDKKNQTIHYQRNTIFIIIVFACLLIFIFAKYFQTNKALSQSLENLKLTQNQLIESEKMAALGSLVAGIAHEVNTPIGIGVTAASFLKDNVQEMSQKFEEGKISKSMFATFMQECIEASDLLLGNLDKAGDLIASFKRISIDNSLDEISKVNIHRVIQDTVTSVQFAYKNKSIAVDIQCERNIEINTYPGILNQIISNLMINAILHGFEEPRPLNKILIKVSAEQGSYTFSFRDDGKGISKENLSSILEPFYTTKRNKGGSGLGLHIVYNLITEKLLSQLNYDSKVGQGTWFEFSLYDLKTMNENAQAES